ncbi:MAG: hypothetical protein J6Y04_00955 [Bacteroidaceae bacterium]|nr:hypothetical protein [Bacteroidaceae bacterium]
MKYDLSQSISQRSSGEKDAENQRIQEIANELSRRCRLHEKEFGNSQSNVSPFKNKMNKVIGRPIRTTLS